MGRILTLVFPEFRDHLCIHIPVSICELLGPLSSFQAFDYAVDDGNTNSTRRMLYFRISQPPNIK